MINFKNSNCDNTLHLKLWQNSKTEILISFFYRSLLLRTTWHLDNKWDLFRAAIYFGEMTILCTLATWPLCVLWWRVLCWQSVSIGMLQSAAPSGPGLSGLCLPKAGSECVPIVVWLSKLMRSRNVFTRLENLDWSHTVFIQFSFCKKCRFMKPLLLSSVQPRPDQTRLDPNIHNTVFQKVQLH